MIANYGYADGEGEFYITIDTSRCESCEAKPCIAACPASLYEEEEDLHVYLLVDISRSMALGDPPKVDYARRVAAALAYIALANLDRSAIFAFAATITSGPSWSVIKLST